MISGSRGKGKLHFGLRYALNGLRMAVLTERNIKIHLIAAILVVIAGVVLSITIIEWAIICLAMSAVISMEMMNTALERALDHLEPEQRELIGIAKDMSAAAVLVTAVFAVVIACLIFLPKGISIFFS
ncbi:diacylglycerol kinase family protein [Gracilibacillus alcaliphilus]|uniref:diacylglycerol kinase family protein n=1 Tax=Gracilibacillus alcaliphilus TaxID=1401441 RepID=UPI00195CD181|nr:diacylglycerol kinase family protein [Gracilibacillus alcaliphilus]MBM7674991.1 undecaprenol kinase/diacylglycerol kinase (ATP) [Gracilibacillus alcaliphilus]